MALKHLYFGKDDAESDSASEGLLSSSFLVTSAYQRAVAGKKRLIIGRKGSGKSAICLRLLSEYAPSGRACIVTPDEISADEVRRFELPGVASEHAKALLWRYIIAIQIGKQLISQATKDQLKEVEKLRAVREFLVENEELDPTTMDRFWRIIQRITGKLTIKALQETTSIEIQAQSSGITLSSKLDVIEANVAAVLNAVPVFSKTKPLYILIDQIERLWSNDRGSDQMVVGLLMAANKAWALYPGVQCTIFLRTDIYEALQFADRDKFRGEESHLVWNRKELLELVERRAMSSLSVKSEILWQSYFPGTVDNVPAKEWLVQRTLLRPRDVIQLCNACRDTAEAKGHEMIDQEDLREASQLYSGWKHNDLLNEWRINFPFLTDLFVLFANQSFTVKKSKLAERFAKVNEALVKRYPSYESSLSLEPLLEILFDIGFIGISLDNKIVYSFENPNGFDPACETLVIHPAFREALRSERALRSAPYQRRLDNFAFATIAAERGAVSPKFARTARGARGQRYASEVLGRLGGICARLEMAQEARDEMASNLRAIEADLVVLPSNDDEGLEAVLTRSAAYIQGLFQELRANQIIIPRTDAYIVFVESMEEIQRLVARSYGEFVRSS